MTSAMELLRDELTKRGVEWEAPTSFDGTAQYDTTAGGYWFHEFDGKITIHGLTPEQAIAATLGRETCYPVPIYGFDGEFTEYECDACSKCGDEWDGDTPNFCPWCGAKVVTE